MKHIRPWNELTTDAERIQRLQRGVFGLLIVTYLEAVVIFVLTVIR